MLVILDGVVSLLVALIRDVVSEFSMMAPTYTRRERGVEGLDVAGSRDGSVPSQKMVLDAADKDAGEGEGGEGGRSRSSSTASTESYRGLWGLLQGFKTTPQKGEGGETEKGSTESSGKSSDGKSIGKSSEDDKSSDSQTSSGTSRELGQGEPFLQWRVIEREKARDGDALGLDYCF